MIPAAQHLQSVTELLDRSSGRARALADALDDEQRLWRPKPKSWGVADCFEHLITTGDEYHPRIRHAIDRGPEPDPEPTYAPRPFQRFFIHMAGPDTSVRLPAPKRFIPPPPRPDAPERFLEQQEELAVLVLAAAQVDLRKTRFASPVTPLLRLSLGEGLDLLVKHQQRHLSQAENAAELLRNEGV